MKLDLGALLSSLCLLPVGGNCVPTTDVILRRVSASAACIALKARNASQVVSKDDDAYTTQVGAHWTANTYGSPTCIFNPATEDDVAAGIKIITTTGTQFAVRSGGHNANKGWASTDEGVLISLSGLTTLSYNQASQSVTIGSGIRWGAVYSELEQYNRIAVGGRCNDVGMGLLMGAGLSYLSALYGLPVDNVISFRVVTADGDVRTVSASSNADLFAAMKGGGNNFGVITSATLKTYPGGNAWGGIRIYNNADVQDRLLAAIAQYQGSNSSVAIDANHDKTAIFSGIQLSGISLVVLYAGDTQEQPAAFAPFDGIPTLQDTTRAWPSFAQFAMNSDPPLSPPRYYVATTSLVASQEAYVELGRQAKALEAEFVSGLTNAALGLIPNTFPSAAARKANAAGSQVGLEAKEQLWLGVVATWTEAADDQAITERVNDVAMKLEKYIRDKGLFVKYKFVNEASSKQNPLLDYPGIGNMRSVARKYDPQQVFQKQLPGGFKLF